LQRWRRLSENPQAKVIANVNVVVVCDLIALLCLYRRCSFSEEETAKGGEDCKKSEHKHTSFFFKNFIPKMVLVFGLKFLNFVPSVWNEIPEF
jgi:hypothetical protein